MDSWHEQFAHSLFRESNDALFLFDPNGDRIYVTEIAGGAIEIIATGRAGLPLHRPQIDEP